jgi:hypothetical protein
MTQDAENEKPQSNLNVLARGRDLPDDIRRAREQAVALAEQRSRILQPRIDAHLKACRLALDAVEAAHQHIADGTDLDLLGDSRQAAVWVMAGRCIGLSRAVLVLLRDGFGAEAAAEARTLHEATRLLDALADEDEPELLERWLADDDKQWVRPWETREARERMRERLEAALSEGKRRAEEARRAELAAQLEEAMRSAGMEQPRATVKASRTIYDVLSRIGHSRRSGVRDAVSLPLRQMATGPHPDPIIRAEYVEWSSHVIEEVVRSVGDACARFFGGDYYNRGVKPIIDALATVRDSHPLDPATLEDL